MRSIPRLAIAVIFLWSAAAKLIDPTEAVVAVEFILRRLSATSGVAAGCMAALCAVEAAIGAALLLNWRPRFVHSFAIGVLFFFSVVLLLFFTQVGAPPCGCTGGLWPGGEDAAVAGIVRNVGLIVLASYSMGARRAADAGRGPPVHEPVESRRAFTLVELLVTIAIVVVLASLLIAGLYGARRGGTVSVAVATIRQVHAACSLYAEDHQGRLPYMATPGSPWLPLVINGSALPDTDAYFSQSRYFANALVPDYYSDTTSLLRPWESETDSLIRSRFLLSHSAFASPKYWSDEPALSDFSQYRPVGLSEVIFPSLKGLLLDLATGVFDPSGQTPFPGPITVGLCDGSAGQYRYDEDLAARIPIRPYGAVPLPTVSTVGGFAGRDFDSR